ncbi:nuclease-related domain-containing protein [Falsibacillus albus]|uniref:NERD domain-containing protein n=1 Tax=Falsibacillus albus TaxID=2478915 RepID=A0A3L7K1H0_9BACI|nr:nuclease-related domain-containing protein [Falsibacillus albus]RLQ96640.1 NERD domain-containing protein [Falsibacillus albus]
MLVKELEKPILLDQLEAFISRILNTYPSWDRANDDFKKVKAGYKGELSLQYPLSYLHHDKYFILHDLRLFTGTHFFQIDVLILSSRFFLILEVKNMVGQICFDTQFEQLVRTIDGKEEGFPNPIKQIQMQCYNLQKWLNRTKYPKVPIETLVVFSNPRSILRTTKHTDDLSKIIIHTPSLLTKIHELEAKYQRNCLSLNKVKHLSSILLENHIPNEINLLERYQSSKDDLIKGVQCPGCKKYPMLKIKRGWHCRYCQLISRDAHLQALRDYLLLVNKKITNNEARDFLNINSRHSVRGLFRSLSIKSIGTKKAARYELAFEKLQIKE